MKIEKKLKFYGSVVDDNIVFRSFDGAPICDRNNGKDEFGLFNSNAKLTHVIINAKNVNNNVSLDFNMKVYGFDGDKKHDETITLNGTYTVCKLNNVIVHDPHQIVITSKKTNDIPIDAKFKVTVISDGI